jgi:GT2 family glycosyltransferase
MSAPLFSVIIPTHNRPQALSACLDALAASTPSGAAFEVIVVDDGGAIDPAPVVTHAAKRLAITLLSRPHRGPAVARNTGAAAARGHYLAFTDDDCLPAHDWLQRLAKRCSRHSEAAVGGRTLNALPDNPFAAASQTLNHYLYEFYLGGRREGGFFATNNLAVPRAGFLALGGFDSKFVTAAAEDREFCARWRSRGFQLVYAPEVIVHHAHNLTLPAFVRQHFGYGRGAHHYHQARVLHGHKPPRLEPLLFYRHMLGYPFRHHPPHQAPLLSALLALAQGAYALGYFAERLILSRQAGRSDNACLREPVS